MSGRTGHDSIAVGRGPAVGGGQSPTIALVAVRRRGPCATLADVAEPIRYLSGDDVLAAMPPVADRLALAERTMIALVADADLPPKVAVHPRPSGSFAHAMPAALLPGDPRRGDDLLGIKWVTGFPDNRAQGLPAIHAVVILSDPVTGRPRAILDGGPITAMRTGWLPRPSKLGSRESEAG